jgi:hypothetical protein
MAEIKESTHCVIKALDAVIYLSKDELALLSEIFRKLDKCREQDGKPINDYYICNLDEPYADKVLQAILDGEDAKNEAADDEG